MFTRPTPTRFKWLLTGIDLNGRLLHRSTPWYAAHVRHPLQNLSMFANKPHIKYCLVSLPYILYHRVTRETPYMHLLCQLLPQDLLQNQSHLIPPQRINVEQNLIQYTNLSLLPNTIPLVLESPGTIPSCTNLSMAPTSASSLCNLPIFEQT